MDNCPETAVEAAARMQAADAEALRPRGLKSTERTNVGNSEAAETIRSEAVLALKAVVVLKAVVDAFQRLGSAVVEDTCPERVDAADSEGPGPPRIETAVLRRFFWRTRKKQEAAGEC